MVVSDLKECGRRGHASGSSKQAWHIPDVVCTFLKFELLMMGGETARNM
jgi:hypothetical protein